ncbi:putative integrase family protein [Candidatus Nitrososphaera gargensis Ga9.2]|uniref:Putative integrase family protein n=1 Tax=Nitrososphaera gargensis (strain Ga9.2) TaxID=1237085 RepID=K0IFN9_NITGG|nr:putative integrase family protein [Candidatus Nitrososphaera gargensis Ga9.2]
MEKCYRNFIDTCKSPVTKANYDLHLSQFKDWMKAKKYSDLLKYKPKPLQEKIIDYINYMKKQKQSPASIYAKLSGIRHFYVMNDLVLNWPRIKKFVGASTKVKVTQDRIYTKEEIRKILEKCDERKRVLVFLMLAGLRIGALPGLKIKHLTKWKEFKPEGAEKPIPLNVYQIIVYAGEPEEYTTFTTVEGAQAIDSYLDYRRRYGEEIKPDAPLIREQFKPENAKEPRPLSLHAVKFLLERALLDAGVRQRGKDYTKRQEVMRFHGFRKYFNTMLQKAGCKPAIKEMLMGHKMGLEDSYLRPDDEELLTEFLKALDLLTISEEKLLKHEVEKLKAATADLDTMKKGYIDIKLELEKKEKEMEKRLEEQDKKHKEDLDKRVAEAVEKYIQTVSGRVDFSKLRSQ